MDRRTFFGSTFVAALTAKVGAFNDAPFETIDTARGKLPVEDNIAGHDLVVEKYREGEAFIIRCRVDVDSKEYGG